MSDTETTEILAHIGRKQIELENSRIAFASLTQEYSNLLLVLSNVLDGNIPAARVSVNLEARSWAIAPEPVEEKKPEETLQ